MQKGSVLVGLLFPTCFCFGLLSARMGCEPLRTPADPNRMEAVQVEAPQEDAAISPEPEPAAALVETLPSLAIEPTSTEDLVYEVVSALERGDRAAFEDHVTAEFARKTVWEILARPNRQLTGSRYEIEPDSTVTLVLAIRDDVSIKERAFHLKTVQIENRSVVAEWTYLKGAKIR